MDEEQGRRKALVPAIETESTEEVGRLFEEHHALVFRAAYRITGHAGDAEDVLQTVFLRVLRREGEAGPMGSPESYLYRAAVNAALDLLRSRQRGPFIPLEEVAPVLADRSALAPDRRQSAGEIREWLRKTVARLSPRAAEMFALRFFEDKENPEIAALLGTSVQTVAVTLHRARQRVEQEFRAYMGEKQ
ncbi:MAG: sigma-70 family RNA polymerase sigma factor [Acidobacteria bacterium]|nr:sigma-70 family RNA polymerase sigma factor [Acidobacteriota bacterium]